VFDIPALVASLKLVDWMSKVPPSQATQLRLAYLLGLVVRAAASGDFGRPLSGAAGCMGGAWGLLAARVDWVCWLQYV